MDAEMSNLVEDKFEENPTNEEQINTSTLFK